MSPIDFLLEQALEIHPLNLVILLAGLLWFLFARAGRTYRIFGWAYVAILGVFLLGGGKPYYLGPLYPLMLAGGACAIGYLLAGDRRAWARAAVVSVMCLTGAAIAPLTLPVLPIERLIAYQRLILGGALPSSERKEVGALPQHFADMFGNEERVALIAEVFRELPPEDRSRCAIFSQEYCYAGAIDLFGRRYGLPKAISGQNNYWLWGPGRFDCQVLIALGEGLDGDDLRETFHEVHVARIFRHKYAMPCRNNMPIFVCRGLKRPLDEVWADTKHFE